MKNPELPEEDPMWKAYFRKKEKREARIHRDYLGWKIYCQKKRYKHSDRDKLIRKYKQRFETWNCEKIDNELVLNDPEYPQSTIIIRFGNFLTPKQNEFSVKIKSQSFDWKRRQMISHAMLGQRILRMLPTGKKESYRITTQGDVFIPERSWKYSLDAFLGDKE